MNTHTRRFNSHFIYACKINRKKTGLFFLIIFMSLTTVMTAIVVKEQLIPIAASLAESQAKKATTLIINQSVSNVLANNGIEYSQLCSIEKNENGEIIAVVPNMLKINELKAQITSDIHSKISDYDTTDISIPIGNLTQNYLLTGRGPKIPIKLLTSGSVNTNFGNSFISSGINQTKHEIYLAVTVSITAMLPVGRTSTNVETKIPITETIIVGKVPAAYLNK